MAALKSNGKHETKENTLIMGNLINPYNYGHRNGARRHPTINEIKLPVKGAAKMMNITDASEINLGERGSNLFGAAMRYGLYTWATAFVIYIAATSIL